MKVGQVNSDSSQACALCKSKLLEKFNWLPNLSILLKKAWFLNAFVVLSVENADMELHASARLILIKIWPLKYTRWKINKMGKYPVLTEKWRVGIQTGILFALHLWIWVLCFHVLFFTSQKSPNPTTKTQENKQKNHPPKIHRRGESILTKLFYLTKEIEFIYSFELKSPADCNDCCASTM